MSKQAKTKEIEQLDVAVSGTAPLSDILAEPLPKTITLRLLTHPKRTYPLPLHEQPVMTLGRGDDETHVDLDMVPHGAFELGVSRYHATFSLTESGVFVTDNGSTNGTRINGFALNANKPYRLRNNDEIEFGQLRTVIRLEH